MKLALLVMLFLIATTPQTAIEPQPENNYFDIKLDGSANDQ